MTAHANTINQQKIFFKKESIRTKLNSFSPYHISFFSKGFYHHFVEDFNNSSGSFSYHFCDFIVYKQINQKHEINQSIKIREQSPQNVFITYT